MKRLIFYKFLIISTLFAACNKVELDPEDGEPVFTAEAKFDGNPKAWQAGVEDFYMFSSFEKDDFDVHVFSGSFTKTDSIVSGESLAFHIRDYQQLAEGSPDIIEALEHSFGFADMSGNDSTLVTTIDTVWNAIFFVTQSIQPSGIQVIYEWDFGDQGGDTTLQDSISHIYEDTPHNVPVTLTVKAANNSCSGFYTKYITANGNAQNCQLNFNIDTFTFNSITITALPSGVAPYQYLWSDSTITGSTYYLQLNPVGMTYVAVTVTDALGCAVSGGLSTTIVSGTLPTICVAAFDYSIQQELIDSQYYQIIYADSLQLSKITIVYTNTEGIQYRSDRQPQEPNATIKILEVDEYDTNEKGEKTKKLTLEFTCRLWNEQGSFIDVTEGKAVIAVAYP